MGWRFLSAALWRPDLSLASANKLFLTGQSGLDDLLGTLYGSDENLCPTEPLQGGNVPHMPMDT
jgi:hypothetical protein